MAGGGEHSGGDAFLWIGVSIGAMLAVTLGYHHFRGPINYALLWASYLLLLPVSHISSYAQDVRLAMLHYCWPGVRGGLVWIGTRDALAPGRCLSTKPNFSPLLHRPFSATSWKNRNMRARGGWRRRRSSGWCGAKYWFESLLTVPRVHRCGAMRYSIRIGYCCRHTGLLLPPHRIVYENHRVGLSQDRLLVCLRPQLGPAAPDRFDPDLFRCGPPPESGGVGINYRRALSTAFLLFALRERKDAYELLDTLSGSFRDLGDYDGNRIIYEMDTSDVEDALAQVKGNSEYPEIVRFLGRHNTYVNPSIAALLELARKGGELAPVRFLWLRAIDRSLWCTLHQLGGRTAWVEGIASWAHMGVENTLGTSTHQIGYSFTLAANSLTAFLSDEEWIEQGREGKDTS